MNDAAITKSFLATNALARRLEQEYRLADVHCQLMTATVRDVYLVRTPQQQFIFFVYRANHRTLAHIAAEWQFVAYLAAHGVPVAPAVVTPTGETILTFTAPEGLRSVRPLSEHEYHMLPLFEAVRAIVEIGVPAMYVDTWGSAYVYSFLDRSLAHLKRSLGQLA